MNKVKLNLMDRLVGSINPQALVKRTQARMVMGAYEEGGYVVPGGIQTSMKKFKATSRSANLDTLTKVDSSRAGSRDLFMNTPIATAAIRRARTNIVGSGLQFQSRIDHAFLGLTVEQAGTWEENLEREFEMWALSKYSDHSGQLNFYENQALAVLSTTMNGDTFFMTPWRTPWRAGNWPYEVCVKMVEADLVRNPNDYEDYNWYTKDSHPGGIEKNKRGEVTHYHVANFYRGYEQEIGEKGKFQRIPVREKNGRPNIFHLAEIERIGQSRGMPWLANVMGPLKQITRLSESALMKAIISSMYTVFVKDMSGFGADQKNGMQPEENEPTEQTGDLEEQYQYELGSGSVIELDEDKEVQVADPKNTDKDFEPFFNSLVGQIAAAIEVPVEQLMLQFNTSYSSARAALLEAWKFWRRKRTWLARNFCQPVMDAFIEEAILKGRIVAPGYFDDPAIKAAWTRGVWVGAGNGQIDPLKETKASKLKIDSNLSTHEEEYVNDNGGRWDSAMNRKAREMNHIDKLDLNPVVAQPAPTNGDNKNVPS